MEDQKHTADDIIATLTEMIVAGDKFDRDRWLDMALALALLRIGEAEKLNRMNQEIADKKLKLMESGKSVAYAEIAMEATPEYTEMKNQKDKIVSMDELVRVAKKNSDSY